MGLWTSCLLAVAIAALVSRAPLPYPAQPAVPVPPAQRPLPANLTGVFAPNTALQQSRLLFKGVNKPETPVVLADGTAYLASAATGQLLRSSVGQPDKLEHVAWPAGQPLGMVMHPDGYLVLCDSAKGLLAVDPAKQSLTLLASRLPNASLAPADADIMFCDDVDVSKRDGRIYFTDASRIAPLRFRDKVGEWDSLGASVLTCLQGSATGRLLVYDPKMRDTRLLVDGIWFANGVALSEDESFVLVVETFSSRVLRHWLAGPQAGTTEVFVEGLPGFPDGVSLAPGGKSFWVAIVSTPSTVAKLLPKSRLLRFMVAWLPAALRPKPTHHGMVVEVSADGRVLRSLHDPVGSHCHTISSAVQVGSTLYMGSLGTSHVCALDLGQSGLAAQ